MKNVYLIPGFMTSQLGIQATGDIVWWDVDGWLENGLGTLRLAPNGDDPGPPDGKAMAVDPSPPGPWGSVLAILRSQLDQTQWAIQVGPYDWRKGNLLAAQSLAANVQAHSTPAQPATLVGHSMGGLICALAYQQLVLAGKQNLVRRMITIGTPFQGSYTTADFLNGTSPPAEQIFTVSQLGTMILTGRALEGRNPFLNNLVLTWPAFYELLPGLTGSEFAQDPNRILLYFAGDYPAGVNPSQTWLDYAKNTFQPLLANPNTFPPFEVATYVYGSGIYTWEIMPRDVDPMDWNTRISTPDGDGVVTKGSATRKPGLVVGVPGAHASLPLGMAWNGLLAQLILDERIPPTPPPLDFFSKAIITENTTDPPIADPVTGFKCIGGHC